jgi:hypothetical protein
VKRGVQGGCVAPVASLRLETGKSTAGRRASALRSRPRNSGQWMGGRSCGEGAVWLDGAGEGGGGARMWSPAPRVLRVVWEDRGGDVGEMVRMQWVWVW